MTRLLPLVIFCQDRNAALGLYFGVGNFLCRPPAGKWTIERPSDLNSKSIGQVWSKNAGFSRIGPCSKNDLAFFLLDIFNQFQNIPEKLAHADFLSYYSPLGIKFRLFESWITFYDSKNKIPVWFCFLRRKM